MNHQTINTWKIMSKKWTIEGSFDYKKSECHYIKNSEGVVIFEVRTLLDGKDNPKRMEEAKARALLACDAPHMIIMLSHLIYMYSEGIKPSVGFINKIEELINKHL